MSDRVVSRVSVGIQAVPGFLMIFDSEGKILYISDNVCDYLGNSAVCMCVSLSACLSLSLSISVPSLCEL